MCNEQRKPHKHAEVIKAWADGATIQFFSHSSNSWVQCGDAPAWYDDWKYRIKPEPKPDVVAFARINCFLKFGAILYSYDELHRFTFKDDLGAMRLTFDGETGKLKKAEVI